MNVKCLLRGECPLRPSAHRPPRTTGGLGRCLAFSPGASETDRVFSPATRLFLNGLIRPFFLRSQQLCDHMLLPTSSNNVVKPSKVYDLPHPSLARTAAKAASEHHLPLLQNPISKGRCCLVCK
ncbi:uncharacterized protein ACIBXB_005078 [Morphnus guianensis]